MKLTKYYPPFQAILAAALFGASTPISKLLLGEIDPILLAALLYLGSGIGAIILQQIGKIGKTARKTEAELTKADIPWLFGAVFAGGIAAPILLLFSLKSTPAATASLLLNFESVATTVIAVVFFKEAVDKRVRTALIFVTLASILLSWEINGSWGISFGALGILGACFLWGLDNNFVRNISSKNPLAIVAIKGIGAGCFSLILSIVLGKPLPALDITVLAGLIGFVCYGLSIALFIRALRNLGSSRTSTLFGTAPFVGMVLSIVLFGTVPNVLFLMALPLMVAGAFLMFSEKHNHAHQHELLEHDHCHSHPDSHHNHDHPGGGEIQGEHAHWHCHEEREHNHTHTPDIHHRHNHQTI